ncbi:hypothetical protein D9M71_590230 [compost metagenome]
MDASLQAFVQLHGGLEQQEYTAEQHDQVTAGEALVEDLDQRLGQGHQPGDAGQQAQAHDQRQRQAEQPRAVTLMGRQLVRQDGDEHQVVDAQDDFQDDQGQEAQPGSGVSYPFHRGQALGRRLRARASHAGWRCFDLCVEHAAGRCDSDRRAVAPEGWGAAPWGAGGGLQQSLFIGFRVGKTDRTS